MLDNDEEEEMSESEDDQKGMVLTLMFWASIPSPPSPFFLPFCRYICLVCCFVFVGASRNLCVSGHFQFPDFILESHYLMS